MGVFDEIKTGLEQALAYEQGRLKAKKVKLSVAPVESFSPGEIKDIRNKTGLTQILFAGYMGVSVKTVEAWEAGTNQPNGVACRMLTLTRNDPTYPKRSGIIT